MLSFFKKIITVLNDNNIPYMLSGSVAMGLYVIPRATRDFDFIVNLKKESVKNFVEAFKDGFYCDEDSVNDAIKSKGLFNIIDFESGYKADFVILKSTPFRQTEFERRKKLFFEEMEVFVVSPEDLVISKLIWIQELQSAIQMKDIEELLTIENLDKVYLTNWVKELKLNTFGLF